MKIIENRLFQSALVGIAVCAFVHPLAAQQSHLAPAAIGQMAAWTSAMLQWWVGALVAFVAHHVVLGLPMP